MITILFLIPNKNGSARNKRPGETEIPLRAENNRVSSTLWMRFAEQLKYSNTRKS